MTQHTAVGWSLSHHVMSCQGSRAEGAALPLLFVPGCCPSSRGHVLGAAAATMHVPLGQTPPASGGGGLGWVWRGRMCAMLERLETVTTSP